MQYKQYNGYIYIYNSRFCMQMKQGVYFLMSGFQTFNWNLLQNLIEIQILKKFKNFLFSMEVFDSNKESVYGSPCTYRRKAHWTRETRDWIVHSKTDTWDVYSIRECKWRCIIARSDLVGIDRFLFRSQGHKGRDADGPSRLSLSSSSSTKSDPELETRFIVCDLTVRLLCVAVLFVDAKKTRLLTGG